MSANPTTPTLQAKLAALLASRKFWSLVVALVTIAGHVLKPDVFDVTAVLGVVAAVSTFCLATGIEDHGVAIAAGNVQAAAVVAAAPVRAIAPVVVLAADKVTTTPLDSTVVVGVPPAPPQGA